MEYSFLIIDAFLLNKMNNKASHGKRVRNVHNDVFIFMVTAHCYQWTKRQKNSQKAWQEVITWTATKEITKPCQKRLHTTDYKEFALWKRCPGPLLHCNKQNRNFFRTLNRKVRSLSWRTEWLVAFCWWPQSISWLCKGPIESLQIKKELKNH